MESVSLPFNFFLPDTVHFIANFFDVPEYFFVVSPKCQSDHPFFFFVSYPSITHEPTQELPQLSAPLQREVISVCPEILSDKLILHLKRQAMVHAKSSF